MSISSVSTSPTPVNYNYPDPAAKPTQPQDNAAADSQANDSSASQPAQAPLPPGQGTRVNQLV